LLRGAPQHRISHEMTAPIVHLLEGVEIDHQQRDRQMRAQRAIELAHERGLHPAAIFQARRDVDERDLFELELQPFRLGQRDVVVPDARRQDAEQIACGRSGGLDQVEDVGPIHAQHHGVLERHDVGETRDSSITESSPTHSPGPTRRCGRVPCANCTATAPEATRKRLVLSVSASASDRHARAGASSHA
jgi:hypothetical protein